MSLGLCADCTGESEALFERLDREAGHREAQVGHGVQRCVAFILMGRC